MGSTLVSSKEGDQASNYSNEGGVTQSRKRNYRIGMWLALASISMMFTGFTSAYILGRGTNNLWQPINPPNFLWINTLVLLASSLTVELGRRATKASELKYWITVTSLLGITFLAGQLWTWKLLVNQGIYLAGNPHSSFFYLLTGVHGLHLFGGILALLYLTVRSWLFSSTLTQEDAVLSSTALYWHFMDGLWIYLLILLFFWR